MPDAPGCIYDEWHQGGKADLYNVLAEARVPINDTQVWQWYPQYRFILNKLFVADRQGLDCAPHGVPAPNKKLISRPIYNLEGLSVGARVVLPDHPIRYRAGYFWCEWLDEPQYSVELVYVNGFYKFAHAMRPVFDEHSIIRWESVPAEIIPDVISYIDRFRRCHLGNNYSGCVTAEVRDGRIIEIMPRMSPQFVDFYADDDSYIENVLEIYRDNKLSNKFKPPVGGVSEVLRVPKNAAWGETSLSPNLFKLKDFEKYDKVRIYVPVEPRTRLKDTADEPWTYRVAYVNSENKISDELRTKILDCVCS